MAKIRGGEHMHKELVYLKGYAKGRMKEDKSYVNMVLAINMSCKLHGNQFRKTGEDYVEHPMKVAKHFLSIGLDNPFLLSAAMLHDVVEDCNITIAELQQTFPSNITRVVHSLTKDGLTTQDYYHFISLDAFATLIKIADRCHNVSTMVEAFSKEKIKSYIKETYDFVIPLCKTGIIKFPEYSDVIYAMRYHIESVCHALEICIKALDEQEKVKVAL